MEWEEWEEGLHAAAHWKARFSPTSQGGRRQGDALQGFYVTMRIKAYRIYCTSTERIQHTEDIQSERVLIAFKYYIQFLGLPRIGNSHYRSNLHGAAHLLTTPGSTRWSCCEMLFMGTHFFSYGPMNVSRCLDQLHMGFIWACLLIGRHPFSPLAG